MELIHISWAGPFQRIIDATGKEWFFEMHSYCGPVVLKKNGDPRKNQPNGNSQFWPAVQKWIKQGKRMNGEYCIYDKGETDG